MTSVSAGQIILTPTQTVGSGETMTSVSAGHIILTPTQTVGSGETMTSVSAGHIILTPTQTVGSGRPQRGSDPGPLFFKICLFRIIAWLYRGFNLTGALMAFILYIALVLADVFLQLKYIIYMIHKLLQVNIAFKQEIQRECGNKSYKYSGFFFGRLLPFE